MKKLFLVFFFKLVCFVVHHVVKESDENLESRHVGQSQ